MKAHLAKLSLALLSAVFLLGCQERGSGPVGLEGLGPEFDKPLDNCDFPDAKGHCHNGDDVVEPEQVTLDLADGMMTTSGLPVTVKTDRDDKLRVNNTDFVHDIQMNFMDLGTCVGFKGTKSSVLPSTDEVAKLEAELHDFSGTHGPSEPHTPGRLVTEGFFVMQIDRTRLGRTSGDHGLLVQHDGTFDGPTGHTRIMLGSSPFDQVGPATVTQDGEGETFQFTGPIVVWAHGVGGGGGIKSNRIIQCPGGATDPNLVTVTLDR